MSDIVEVSGLTVRYSGATALDGVDLTVGAGEMVALIGANGAGKSTLVKALSGLLEPDAGTVAVRGRLAQVPEGREMFGDLSVDDNLRLGGWRNGRHGRDTSAVYELFPELGGLRRRRAGTLSGGQQQMVAIGRALMARPDVLVIDELSLGLAPLVVTMLAGHLRQLHASRGLAVLLIEQNARLALELCDRAYVLEAGRIALHGTSADLARDARVTAAYLGGHVAAS
ncbi:putative ABC transporter ATP-binding protein [Actinoplanes missouriensis 431]|uniref:Putative ABC transporter ATP-binding protein n=1 Tax=Actinoplanes missouriensis (strain ATCC 14538 / DSM 43046 / CBS 188.64 / JCM 3121 / NBRC 102363 / NCIMB 12654 / NRRL B-3342 / UNCC 431) TaxID=512565 RepID=I0HD19_ACTM4|nr:ABC transporter ATP-binding protein [Actinoplanes missouriensis]BAL90906.1 putative ABC transporter ATP-binding protein [Actinoplanes missouriensis 431]